MPKNKTKFKGITELYSDDAGKLVDVGKLEQFDRYGRAKIVLITVIVVLLLLAGAAWSGFLLFYKYWNKFNTGNIDGVKIEVEAPTEVSAGEQVNFLLRYRNLEKIGLNNVRLVVSYPAGLVEREVMPLADTTGEKRENQDVWTIGTLASGGEGKVEILGRLIAGVDEKQTLTATVYYEPENFSSTFQEVAIHEIKVLSSQLEVKIEGPIKIFTEEEGEYSVKYKNIATTELKDIKFEVEYPQGFTATSVEPGLVENAIVFPSLTVGEEGEIKINGQFAQGSDGLFRLKTRLYLGTLNGEYFLQEEEYLEIESTSSESLSLSLLVNGSSDLKTINLGDTLNISLVYENKSGREFKNLKVTSVLDPVFVFTESSIVDQYEAKVVSVGDAVNLVWTKDNIAKLASLDPGEKGVINYSIALKDKKDFKGQDLSKLKTAIVNTVMQVELEREATGDKNTNEDSLAATNLKLESNKFSLAINTDLDLTISKAGPLPTLLEDNSVVYQVTWTLTNSLHEVDDLQIRTKLPTNISWLDKTVLSAGDISLNTNREVVWTLNRMPTNLTEPITVQFSLKVDNSVGGKFLTEDTTLEARDKDTAAKLVISRDAVTY